jgi:hypothetical protein
MPSEKDVLKALVEETLATNPHPDRASVLQEWHDANTESQPEPDAPTAGGQGAGGEPKGKAGK